MVLSFITLDCANAQWSFERASPGNKDLANFLSKFHNDLSIDSTRYTRCCISVVAMPSAMGWEDQLAMGSQTHVEPTPRSFSDIFTGGNGVVLVKKSEPVSNPSPQPVIVPKSMPAIQPEMSAVVDDVVKKPVPDEVTTQNSQMNEMQGENYEDSQERQLRCDS